MLKNKEQSVIRIEDTPSELSYSTNVHSEAESLWLKKIEEMRQRIEFVGKRISD